MNGAIISLTLKVSKDIRSDTDSVTIKITNMDPTLITIDNPTLRVPVDSEFTVTDFEI